MRAISTSSRSDRRPFRPAIAAAIIFLCLPFDWPELKKLLWRLADMPRYFFHVDGRRVHRDQVGEDLNHDDAAWEASMRALRELEYGFSPGEEWQLQVCHDDLPVFIIKVSSSKLR